MENYEDNPRSIKYHVKQFFIRNKERFNGKTIIDFPAGNGVTSNIMRNLGAKPVPFDLFPEYFNIDGLTCERANINEGIPYPQGQADHLICQEGIEHFTDQMLAMKEFNKVLKPGGTCIITTPNYSNLRGKLSFFLSESERFNSIIAPNELDSIWMSKQDITNEVYYGHIFLIGILKLRCIAKLAGFKIRHIQYTRVKSTSVIILFFTYPWIWLSNYITYKKRMKKNKDHDYEVKKATYKEIFDLAVNWRLLIDGHIFVEFEKESEISEVGQKLKSQHKEFGTT